MSELQGQLDMSALIEREKGKGKREKEVPGYDAEGHLLDVVPDVYAMVPAEDADKLRYLAAGIRADFDAARERVLHMGMLLMEARQRCPEGRWLQWIKDEARLPERTAQQAMQLYETFGAMELPEGVTASHLVELLRAPEADREALMERAAAEGLSTRQLKEEIKQLREEYQRAQVSIHDLHVELEEADRVKDRLQEDVKAAQAERDRMTKQAEDAVKRANKADEKRRSLDGALAKANVELEDLKNRAPETVEVERIPDDVAAELEKLKAENAALKNSQGKPRSNLVEQFVYLVKRFNVAFSELTGLIIDIRAEDEAKAEECQGTLKKVLENLRGRLGE